MIVKPKFRGFLGTTAHPVGCYHAVRRQIQYAQSHASFRGIKNALVIGASTGYGLASRIVSSFSGGAGTLGVLFERAPTEGRTASPGWYNTSAFEKIAHMSGYRAESINGDAFSSETKEKAVRLIKEKFGFIDLVVYSLAAPRRKDLTSGKTYTSVLKPIGEAYKNKTLDPWSGEVKNVLIQPATEEEIESTVRVMGGEDWLAWIDCLTTHGLLSEGVKTVAYSYIGPELTHCIYKNGTIGQAKRHLLKTASALNKKLSQQYNGQAFISVNKALVTQASAAIPVVPLYLSVLYKLMKEKGTHEGCIEQIYRLFKNQLYASQLSIDEQGCIRMDDWEMDSALQSEIRAIWPKINSSNVNQLASVEGYRQAFYELFGFGIEEVDYNQEVETNLGIPSISEPIPFSPH